jgi:hypothetical protein
MLKPTPEIVPATGDDVARYYGGIEISGQWHAKAMRKGSLVAGMGGVIETEPGVWVGFLEVPDGERKPSLYRHVIDMLNAAKASGATEIRTWCDDSIPRAEAMMRRLGFKPTDEEIDGKTVHSLRIT